MEIGTVLTNKNVSKLLLQIIKTINDEQSNNWFIINDEIYQRNAPYDVTGVYTPELIEDLFDFDNLLIVSGVFYATQISITQEEVIERLQRISAIETTNRERLLFMYVIIRGSKCIQKTVCYLVVLSKHVKVYIPKWR